MRYLRTELVFSTAILLVLPDEDYKDALQRHCFHCIPTFELRICLYFLEEVKICERHERRSGLRSVISFDDLCKTQHYGNQHNR